MFCLRNVGRTFVHTYTHVLSSWENTMQLDIPVKWRLIPLTWTLQTTIDIATNVHIVNQIVDKKETNQTTICIMYSLILLSFKKMIKMKPNILKTWYQVIDRLHFVKLFFLLSMLYYNLKQPFYRGLHSWNSTKFNETKEFVDMITTVWVVLCKSRITLLTDGH